MHGSMRVIFVSVYNLNGLERAKATGFTPLIYPNEDQRRRELQGLECIYKLIKYGEISQDSLIGLFSDSFTKRTGLTDHAVREVIDKNPGRDIYVFSPSQYNRLIFFNVWDQAEFYHEGIIDAAKASGIVSEKETKNRSEYSIWSYCNYWIARKQIFLDLVETMISAEHRLSALGLAVKNTFHRSPVRDKWSGIEKDQNCLLPFIIERITSVYLSRNDELNSYYWEDPRSPMNQVEKIDWLLDVVGEPLRKSLHNYSQLHEISQNHTKQSFYDSLWDLSESNPSNHLIPGSIDRLRSLF